MNVEIGTEAAQFPEKEYINGIFVAVSNKITSVSFTFRNRVAEPASQCYKWMGM
jgi:hypothetical protein